MFEIKVLGNDREFTFEADTEAECLEWVAAICSNIKVSKGFRHKLPGPSTYGFWRQETIDYDEFRQLADTFDILLFRCNSTSGSVIRTYTNCEFDHVAMVIRYESEPNEVFLLEAESGNGVSIKRWSEYDDEPGTFYTKVALRHLEWERPDNSLTILE